ncbi:MAG: ATP-binding protein [Euryarchaeota archaeon]|nr:ATP-binding protein [Euryarchaeota archaeon]
MPHWIRELLNPPQGQWTLVAGPRQVGKTTGLGHVVKGLLDQGIPPPSITVIPWDQPALLRELGTDLDAVISALSAKHAPTPDQPLFLLFDKIQDLPDWSRRLKAAWDRHRRVGRVLATDSSALKLIRPVEADFQGRIQTQTIFPMKFREVVETHPDRLRHADDKVWSEVASLAKEARGFIREPKADKQLRAALANVNDFVTGQDPPLDPFLRKVFQDYCVWGGYPRVRPGQPVDLGQRRAHFDQAWNAIIAKDAASLKLTKTREFTQLFQQIAANPGGKFVAAAVAMSLGVKHTTVSDWKRILEDAFLVQQLAPLNSNLRPTKAKDKAYLLDPGWYGHHHGVLATEDVTSDNAAMGLLVETVLVDHTRRLQFNITKSQTMPIGYVDDPEVDIVADFGTRLVLVEAMYRNQPKRSVMKVTAPASALRVIATRQTFDVTDPAAVLVPAHLWALIA